MKLLWLVPVALLFASCSSLPLPGPTPNAGSSGEAAAVLKQAAVRQGNPWKNHSRVEVGYDGHWSTIATRLQPVITDPGFRKSSQEIYQPRPGRVSQRHSGPQGTKDVMRQGRRVEVSFNGVRSADPEVNGAAALVADAYTIFLFGPSWLTVHGRDLTLLPEDRSVAGESCDLIAGRLSPGLGNAGEDYFIVWIGKNSGLMKRFQFSLNGMDSTRGADVDVVFSEHWTAANGSVWPARFIERIQRPIPVQAHDWRMTTLTLDGRKMK